MIAGRLQLLSCLGLARNVGIRAPQAALPESNGRHFAGCRGATSGRKCAVFQLEILTDNNEGAKLTMKLSGELVVEVDTCRTVAVNLNGPVGASEVHGPDDGQFHVHSEGTIKVAVRADYGKRR